MMRNARYFPYMFIIFMLDSFLRIYLKLSGKGIYCQTLSGNVYTKINLNCDMMVTCNCHDAFGLGFLGELGDDGFFPILRGKRAMRFRRLLAMGRTPITNCLVCSELVIADKKKVKRGIPDYHSNTSIVVAETTALCNLRCVTCRRKSIALNRKRMQMTESDVRLLSKSLRKDNIDKFDLYNLGEPFLSGSIERDLSIIREENPGIYITISTNATMVDSMSKMRAAMLTDLMIFSIHGSTQKSTYRYQRGTDFNKAYSNMKSFVKLRSRMKKKKPKIVWKYVLFRWNESEDLIKNAIELGQKAGVDEMWFELTISPIFGAAYRHFLGRGYLDQVAKRVGKAYVIKF
jgi:organic radical activating enzyme